MIAFRRHLLLFLALATFQGSWFLVPWAVSPPGPSLTHAAAIVWGLALATITFFIRMRHPVLTSWLYVAGSVGLFSLIAFAFRPSAGFSLLPLSVLVAGLLLGPWSGAVVGVVVSAIIVFGGENTPGLDARVFWLALAWVAGGIGLIAGHALAQVDYWEQALVEEQRQSIVRLQDRQGELNRTLKAYHDALMRLERTNEELAVARQLAEEARVMKEQFAASVSHELRTPLNIIVGFAEEMYLFPESYAGVTWTPALQGDIEEMYRASRHLQSLVNDVLDLARIDSMRLPIFRAMEDIGTIVNEAIQTAAPLIEQQGLSYTVDCPPDLPKLYVDSTRIRQVLLNLLNNAVRFTDVGSIAVQVEQQGDEVVVSVRDSGIGIPPDQLHRVFDEFAQVETGLRRRGGTGLGLAVSRQFVMLHGGRMWVESELGRGSTFHFSLPLPGTVPPVSFLFRTPQRHPVDSSKAPVVVVDPSPSIPDLLGRYLGERAVLGASDMDEAAALTQQEHPAAVIVNLPPDTPAEAWTAPPRGAIAQLGVPVFRLSIPSPSWLQHSAGFDRCLTKPVSREMLELTVNECERPVSVLVVDDDAGFVRLLTRVLESLEAVSAVHTAYNGTHALRLAREVQPNLPEMDGFEVLQALRAMPELGPVRVVALTATMGGEEARADRPGRLTLTQATGLNTATLLSLLNAALGLVRPGYAGAESTSSSA